MSLVRPDQPKLEAIPRPAIVRVGALPQGGGEEGRGGRGEGGRRRGMGCRGRGRGCRGWAVGGGGGGGFC